MDTIWILGDQLGRHAASLEDARPADARILLVESEALLRGRRWHRQRAWLVLTAMRRFAGELEAVGFQVDHRRAASLRAGLRSHRRRFAPGEVRAMEPASWDGRALLAVEGVEARGYAHQIQRLMVLGNLALLAGVRPAELVDWMHRSFVDGAEWVMLPNALSMALYADGGRMTTKPYAAGGAYIHRMSDACGRCPYDPRRRTGDDACPFTTLSWDFVARHRERLAANPRTARAVHGLDRLKDLPAVPTRAKEVLEGIGRGEI